MCVCVCVCAVTLNFAAMVYIVLLNSQNEEPAIGGAILADKKAAQSTDRTSSSFCLYYVSTTLKFWRLESPWQHESVGSHSASWAVRVDLSTLMVSCIGHQTP